MHVNFEKEDERIIIFVDMTGSSAAWANNPAPMKDTVRTFNCIILNLAKKFKSELSECNFTGDGWMLSFYKDNIINAVNLGWLMPHIWWQMGGHLFRLRVGVYAGMVNFYKIELSDSLNGKHKNENNSKPENKPPFEYLLCGDAINRAARLEAESKKSASPERYADHICFVGESVKEMLEKEVNISEEDKLSEFLSDSIHFEFESGKLDQPDWSCIYKVKAPIYCKNNIEGMGEVLKKIKVAQDCNNCGGSAGKEKDYESAIKYFRESIEILEDKTINNFFNLSNCINRNGQNKTKDSDFFSCIYRRNLGKAYSKNGDHNKAIESLEKVKKILEPFKHKSPLHLKRLGDAYKRAKKYKKALSIYLEAFKLYPKKNFERPDVEKSINFCRCKIMENSKHD